MILIVSHFTKNKGVTDFFIDFLLKKDQEFYVIKHPFTSADLQFSELILYKNGQSILVTKIKKTKSDLINLVMNFFVTLLFSLKLGKKIDVAIAFGSFNVTPLVLTNILFLRKVCFWGVDYSRKRFANYSLNRIYFLLETIASKYSSFTINQSLRQEEARIKFHSLDKTKSILSTNGIEATESNKTTLSNVSTAFIYIGSLTKQHGIVDFIKFFYIDNDIKFTTFIIGDGEERENLINIMAKAHNPEKIKFLGFKTQEEIRRLIMFSDDNMIGIAPYTDKINDHVYYGDSIKIKEYLNYDLPYIASDVVCIPNDLIEFGIVFHSFEDLLRNIENVSDLQRFNKQRKDKVLEHYQWAFLFSDVIKTLNIL